MYKYNTSYLLPIGSGVNVNKLKQFEINHLSSQSTEEKKKVCGDSRKEICTLPGLHPPWALKIYGAF